MSQSSLIAGTLLAGFALFLASRDRLSTYGRVLWGDKPDSHSTTGDEKGPQESGVGQSLEENFDQYFLGGGGILKDMYRGLHF